jgi:hypothetical protein
LLHILLQTHLLFSPDTPNLSSIHTSQNKVHGTTNPHILIY